MEFKQPIGELLTPAIDLAHRLRDGGVNIATIADALARAGFPENIQMTVRMLLASESNNGYKPPIRYQQQLSYL